MPVDLKGESPPFELKLLTEVPQEEWRGLPVFHPLLSVGGVPYWDPADYPELHRDEDDVDGAAYDVGVVLEWWADEVHPEVPRVLFIGSSGSRLHYAADNLWVPARFVR